MSYVFTVLFGFPVIIKKNVHLQFTNIHEISNGCQIHNITNKPNEEKKCYWPDVEKLFVAPLKITTTKKNKQMKKKTEK